MTLAELCGALSLPPEVRGPVLAREPVPRRLLEALTRPETAEGAYEEVKTLCRGDGLADLAVQLQAALLTRERYREQNIPEFVFFDTMGCFPRFVNEHLASFGRYGFDRGFWTWRQLSLQLFRVGELEYQPRKQAVSLHIPSGADLRPEVCRESLDAFHGLFPQWRREKVTLRSWLLSPALAALLEPGSRILRFAACFQLQSWDMNSTEFYQWVYGRDGIPVEELPEDTSLRRRMKQLLLEGGKVGAGSGVLMSFDLP